MGDRVPDADPFRVWEVAGHTEPQFSSGLRAHERRSRDWETLRAIPKQKRLGILARRTAQGVDHRSGARVNGTAVVTSRARGTVAVTLAGRRQYRYR